MKKIRKIIIPAAGWGTRFLPLTKVVHKELVPILNKPIIHHLAKEAADAGVEEVILIISPRKLEILKYFTINANLEMELEQKKKVALLHEVKETNQIIKVFIAIQNEQLGLGHAILMAADLVGDEPFGIILGDDLIDAKVPVMKQLIDAYNQTGSSIIGVQTVLDKDISKYGIVKPKDESQKEKKLFEINGAIEKPELTKAPSRKAILGRYVFTPEIMKFLRKIKPKDNEEINIVDAFEELLKIQKIYAFEFTGKRYDLGSVEGFVKAQIDYALQDENLKATIKEHILDLFKK